MTLAGWLATSLLILPGCKFCDLMTELKEGKTLQGGWIVPLCFPNVIPLPCTEFFIPEGNQVFQSQGYSVLFGIEAVGKARGLYV